MSFIPENERRQWPRMREKEKRKKEEDQNCLREEKAYALMKTRTHIISQIYTYINCIFVSTKISFKTELTGEKEIVLHFRKKSKEKGSMRQKDGINFIYQRALRVQNHNTS